MNLELSERNKRKLSVWGIKIIGPRPSPKPHGSASKLEAYLIDNSMRHQHQTEGSVTNAQHMTVLVMGYWALIIVEIR